MSEKKHVISILRCREAGVFKPYYPYSSRCIPHLEIVSFANYNIFEEPTKEVEEILESGDIIVTYDIKNDIISDEEYDKYRDEIYLKYYIDKDHFNKYWKPQILANQT